MPPFLGSELNNFLAPSGDFAIEIQRRHDNYDETVLVIVPRYEWGYEARFSMELRGSDQKAIMFGLRDVLTDLVPPLIKWIPREIGTQFLSVVVDSIVRDRGSVSPRGPARLAPFEAMLKYGPLVLPEPPKPKPEHPDAWMDKAVQAMKKV